MLLSLRSHVMCLKNFVGNRRLYKPVLWPVPHSRPEFTKAKKIKSKSCLYFPRTNNNQTAFHAYGALPACPLL